MIGFQFLKVISLSCKAAYFFILIRNLIYSDQYSNNFFDFRTSIMFLQRYKKEKAAKLKSTKNGSPKVSKVFKSVAGKKSVHFGELLF